jgi:hypothetical protein
MQTLLLSATLLAVSLAASLRIYLTLTRATPVRVRSTYRNRRK